MRVVQPPARKCAVMHVFIRGKKSNIMLLLQYTSSLKHMTLQIAPSRHLSSQGRCLEYQRFNYTSWTHISSASCIFSRLITSIWQHAHNVSTHITTRPLCHQLHAHAVHVCMPCQAGSRLLSSCSALYMCVDCIS